MLRVSDKSKLYFVDEKDGTQGCRNGNRMTCSKNETRHHNGIRVISTTTHNSQLWTGKHDSSPGRPVNAVSRKRREILRLRRSQKEP